MGMVGAGKLSLWGVFLIRKEPLNPRQPKNCIAFLILSNYIKWGVPGAITSCLSQETVGGMAQWEPPVLVRKHVGVS